MWLVVGLGNPGGKYQDTRHNAGFLVVDEVARRWGMSMGRSQLGARTGRGDVARSPALLAQPQGYMNRSGGPVGALQCFYGIPNECVVVIHDDLDLPLGTVRIKRGGGHGGHNGLRDLHAHLGTEYARVRVGISRPPPSIDSVDWVLGAWSDTEREALSPVVDRSADAVEAIITDGVTRAMNAFNVRPRRKAAAPDETQPEGQDPATPAALSAEAEVGSPQNSAPRGQGAE
jgi:peptidyl-tRNA hydrolase, PTH1 family